mgnify:CR=1 FL=1
MRDKVERGRQPHHRGATNPRAKMTEEVAQSIFDETRTPYYGQVREIARKYNVSEHSVTKIKRGQSWQHLISSA